MQQSHTVKGLAIVRRHVNGSKILLVRTAPNSPWILPVTSENETVEDLLTSIQSELMTFASFSRCENIVRRVRTRDGAMEFELIGAEAELRPYIESDRFVDARWASFEEARHAARADLEIVVQWARYQQHNLRVTETTAH
jgi:hypothetical protein